MSVRIQRSTRRDWKPRSVKICRRVSSSASYSSRTGPGAAPQAAQRAPQQRPFELAVVARVHQQVQPVAVGRPAADDQAAGQAGRPRPAC